VKKEAKTSFKEKDWSPLRAQKTEEGLSRNSGAKSIVGKSGTKPSEQAKSTSNLKSQKQKATPLAKGSSVKKSSSKIEESEISSQ
jgi:hypothetical protein